MPSYNNLTTTAARLAAVAPQEWNSFLGALAAYTQEQVHNLTRSPLEELPRAQGRAQIAAETLEILSECQKASAKLEKR